MQQVPICGLKLWRLRAMIVLPILIGLSFVGCAGSSNERIANMAQSGIVFTAHAPGVYDYAFDRAVSRENQDLIKKREKLRKIANNDESRKTAAAALNTAYEDTKRQFIQRLNYFTLMKEHAWALREYFLALNVLASGAKSEAAGNAANGIVTELTKFEPDIKQVSIGGSALSDLIKPVTALAIGAFTNHRLNEHLQANAKTVLEAIGYQQAMFQLLVNIERDRKMTTSAEKLRRSFVNLDQDLPSDWSQKSRESLTFEMLANPITAALAAAEQLAQNFQLLVEGNQGAVSSLERSVVYAQIILDIYQTSKKGGEL